MTRVTVTIVDDDERKDEGKEGRAGTRKDEKKWEKGGRKEGKEGGWVGEDDNENKYTGIGKLQDRLSQENGRQGD